MITPLATSPIKMELSAFISGLTPNRTDDHIFIGNVVADGPVANEAITKSSKDSVKANNQLETTAGAIIGRVINLNASNGDAPKSRAASSNERSNVANRDDTTTDTKHIENVVCAKTIVITPRSIPIPMNNKSNDKPVMTSGITSGA